MDPWRLAFHTNIRPTSVEINGEKVLNNGVATRVDAEEVRAKAAEQAKRLFTKLDGMP